MTACPPEATPKTTGTPLPLDGGPFEVEAAAPNVAGGAGEPNVTGGAVEPNWTDGALEFAVAFDDELNMGGAWAVGGAAVAPKTGTALPDAGAPNANGLASVLVLAGCVAGAAKLKGLAPVDISALLDVAAAGPAAALANMPVLEAVADENVWAGALNAEPLPMVGTDDPVPAPPKVAKGFFAGASAGGAGAPKANAPALAVVGTAAEVGATTSVVTVKELALPVAAADTSEVLVFVGCVWVAAGGNTGAATAAAAAAEACACACCLAAVAAVSAARTCARSSSNLRCSSTTAFATASRLCMCSEASACACARSRSASA